MSISAFFFRDTLVASLVTAPMSPVTSRELMLLVRTWSSRGIRRYVLDLGTTLNACALATLGGILLWLPEGARVLICGGESVARALGRVPHRAVLETCETWASVLAPEASFP